MARRHRPSTRATSRKSLREPSARKGVQPVGLQRQDSSPAEVRPFAFWEWLFVAALVVAILLVYQPAWRGGILWDDDKHITLPDLRSWDGLWRIWFDVGATLQYYPMLHSAFWIEHRLWGGAMLGYHLVNIFWHATAAFLVALILRRLAFPGAYLAAAIFALHPVQAESVAWITEQKNTLSAVFYLAAMLVYLYFDQTGKKPLYCWALGLFLLAILSKTVTATLPGALLVIFWWQRGRLSWKKDVLPLVPFFLLGAGGGMITAWWELKINNCVGPEFEFTLVERLLIAGRAIWFHLWKLCWPTDLTFIYPRWQIDPAAWWQYLFPLGVMGLVVGLWSIRRRTRAPLAALLFFGGTLFPVLGFFNLYTFRYSLVANHYQYLASLGPIILAAAGAALLFARWQPWPRRAGYAVSLVMLAVLAGLTWRQSQMYGDIETLYGKTIAENPDCWLAHGNLGVVLAGRGQVDEAIAHYRKSLEIKPDYALSHYNLGAAFAHLGRIDEAMAHYQKAVEIQPDYVEAHYNLGVAFVRRGGSTRRWPIIRRLWKSSPTTPRPTTAWATPWLIGAVMRRRWHSIGRPWKSSRTTSRLSTTWATPWPIGAELTRRWHSIGRRWKSSPTTSKLSTTLATPYSARVGWMRPQPVSEGCGNQAQLRRGPLQPWCRLRSPGADRRGEGSISEGVGNQARPRRGPLQPWCRPHSPGSARRGHGPFPAGTGNRAQPRRDSLQPRLGSSPPWTGRRGHHPFPTGAENQARLCTGPLPARHRFGDSSSVR